MAHHDSMFVKPLQVLLDALSHYDSTEQAREDFRKSACSEEEFAQSKEFDRQALELVQDAFYELTSDRNTREQCHHAPIWFLRRMAFFHEKTDILRISLSNPEPGASYEHMRKLGWRYLCDCTGMGLGGGAILYCGDRDGAQAMLEEMIRESTAQSPSM